MTHPEDYCHRCGGPNVTWSAPSPLWNYVMRGGENWPESYNGIVCPVCFAQLCELAGVGGHDRRAPDRGLIWRLIPDPDLIEVDLPLTKDGRVWDPDRFFWREPMGGVMVTVRDLASGDVESKLVQDHDYFVLATGDCHVSHTQVYPTSGTHLLTIKGQRAGAVSTTPAAGAADGEDTSDVRSGDAGSSPAARSEQESGR